MDRLFLYPFILSRIRILFRERTKVEIDRSIRINSILATRRVNIDNIDLDKCLIYFAFQIAPGQD